MARGVKRTMVGSLVAMVGLAVSATAPTESMGAAGADSVGSLQAQISVAEAQVAVAEAKVLYQKWLNLNQFEYIGDAEARGVNSSPTLAGKYIFITGNFGTTLVLKPGRTYEPIALNHIAFVVLHIVLLLMVWHVIVHNIKRRAHFFLTFFLMKIIYFE